ncbi:MAG: PEP-CTERM sorting domain-containing protein [Planctomycetes bacterium]|nr:PEP-CTERM sorting domain-containing protein [Planctomycetota bacterium]
MNYGMVASLAATSTAVPEPATGIMLMLGMAVMLTGRRAAVSKPVR